MRASRGSALAAPLVALVVLVLVATSLSAGCRKVRLEDVPGAEIISSEATTVPLGSAQALDTTIRMGVGELKLAAAETSGAALDAEFNRVPADWRPEVGYSVDGTTGALVVRQSDSPKGFNLGPTGNEWVLGLAPGVPTNLTLEVGAGASTVDLRGVLVRRLDVVAGVGKTTIDLAGPRAADVSGRVECGVGDLALVVPSGIGVRLRKGEAGIGKLEALGFKRVGDDLVNSAWGSAGPSIDLEVTQGVGEVTVRTAD